MNVDSTLAISMVNEEKQLVKTYWDIISFYQGEVWKERYWNILDAFKGINDWCSHQGIVGRVICKACDTHETKIYLMCAEFMPH